MLIFTICISFLYALPNLYGEDPSIQITGVRGTVSHEKTMAQVQKTLEKENIKSKSITLKNGIILVRFNNTDIQLRTLEILVNSLGKQYIAALHLAPSTPKWLDKLGGKPMKLGLDLRGGVHFLIEVDINSVLDKLQEQNINRLRNNFHQTGISYCFLRKGTNNYSIEMNFRNEYERRKAEKILTDKFQDLVFSYDNNIMTASMTDERLREIHNYAVSQNIIIIRNRVNQLGVSEPLVQRQGLKRIIVELPGIQDTVRAKDILGATATLEFRLVNSNIDLTTTQNLRVPFDSEIKYSRNGVPYLLYKRVILTGDHITNSSFSSDENGAPQVNVNLDSDSGLMMSNFTRNNQNKFMATLFIEYKDSGKKDTTGRVILVKDEKVINIASISANFGSQFRITGIRDQNEARQLSLLLRAGALTAPIQVVGERTIGPTLGIKNIEKGLKNCIASLLVSVLFMTIYYRKFGLIASAALIVNLVMIIGIMSLLPGATLTMAGIAGIVLTLAVSVDANVLINERIKEELKHGRSVQNSIHEGYKNAFSSIIDANLTTLITAVILYAVGAGSIKGFAITTTIGIATSMFTAIIGTRAIVNLLYGGKRVKKLSI
ncbi:Protein translocase subunit SecD [Candidatus Hartigia pinicola]|nr:Protein translocase subunit SecD [Candidatus Hartigia pinicola]